MPAFTLVELLVVIAIIGVLIAMLLPALNVVRDQARTVQCASNLRQLQISMIQYANDNKGYIMAATCLHGHYWMTLPGCSLGFGLISGKYIQGYRPAVGVCAASPFHSSLLGNCYTTYGINVLVSPMMYPTNLDLTSPYYKPMYKITQIRRPTQVIHLSDAGPRSNTSYTIEPETERVGRIGIWHRGKANASFLDGHVGQVKREDCSTFDPANPNAVNQDFDRIGVTFNPKSVYAR